MKRFVIIVAALAVLCAALGWLQAGSSANAGAVDNQAWETLPQAAGDAAAISRLGTQIRAANLFVLSAADEQARIEGAVTEVAIDPNAPAPFPAIGAVSSVNKIPVVTLINADGSLLSVKAGDQLPSGWLIKTVDQRQVIAVFEGQETRFPVTRYLDTAFDRLDTDEDQNGPPSGGGEN